MIEINLLPGRKKAAKGGGGAGFKLPDFKGLISTIKDPWLIGAVVTAAVVIGGAGALFVWDGQRLRSANSRLDEVRDEKRRFDVVIAQKHNFEKVRDSLVAQINVIRRIDADRYIWPHILDQVTKSLPPYTWIVNLQASNASSTPNASGGPQAGAGQQPVDSTGVPAVLFTIDGRTVDIEAFTTFLRQLAASPWFTDVQAAKSQTVVEADRPVTAFTITARYRVADSAFIRTVPLVQSVR
jgi:Tfp pilus assembly protein PilN